MTVYQGSVACEGRRERKKSETRRRIHRAALQLVAEHGFANVTTEQIAIAADVSPRTLFNYFPTKEAAVAGVSGDLPERVVAELASRPADEPPMAALEAVMAAHLSPDTDLVALRALRARAFASSPEIVPTALGALAQVERDLARALAQRLGLTVGVDPYPTLAAAAALAALRTTMLTHDHDERGAPQDARATLHECFVLLTAGLPDPSQPRP